MKTIFNLSRYIAGILFITSGLAKGIDPVGTVIKLGEYLATTGIEPGEVPLLVSGIMLSTIEFITGFCLVAGIRIRLASVSALILMSVFTPLTFILAIYNPVTDCGCFGDLVHFTNWQTFYKNILLTVPVIIIFSGRKEVKSSGRFTSEWLITIFSIIIFVLFSAYNYMYLPVSDFRPYRTGVNLLESMAIPDGAPTDEYKTTLLYKKEGVVKEFTLENYPSGDTSWVFVDQKSRLIKKGYQPPIHDFNLSDIQGYDRTEEILSHPGYTMFIVANDQERLRNVITSSGNNIFEKLTKEGVSIYILTSSSTLNFSSFLPGTDILFVDATALKTFIRSDPGFILLKEGTILGKWSYTGFPGYVNLQKMITSPVKDIDRNPYMGFLLALLATVLAAAGIQLYLRK